VGSGQPSMLEALLPFAFMIGVFYFLIIRPQGRRLKAQDQLLTNLKRGDAVFTSGGILGVVDGLTDTIVSLEVSNGVKIKMLRKQISGLQSSLEKNADKKKE
jgi:preprotein translocase subunit YajC